LREVGKDKKSERVGKMENENEKSQTRASGGRRTGEPREDGGA
jgi:hypothetical protein